MKPLIALCLLLTGSALYAQDPVAEKLHMDSIVESARQIPVAYDVDVVVVGGSAGAVAAAVEAANSGVSVFLAAPRLYLGDDICGTLRLWLEEGEQPTSDLAKRLFGKPAPPSPMHVKKTLDDALLAAKVPFLFGCFPTDILVDPDGKPAGIVMANRAGRQAVRAKVIVDATPRAAVARLAGAAFAAYPARQQVFERVVIGGQKLTDETIAKRRAAIDLAERKAKDANPANPAVFNTVLGDWWKKKGRKETEDVKLTPRGGQGVSSRVIPNLAAGKYDAIVYTLLLPMADGSARSFAQAEQMARDKTFDPNQLDASEFLFQIPPDAMTGSINAAGKWSGVAAIDLGCCRPAGLERVFVLGGCIDVPRDWAAKLLRPLALMDMGARIGRAAADEAKNTPKPAVAGLPGNKAGRTASEVRELLVGVRPSDEKRPTITAGQRGLPVLGAYDVVVVGGGTAGAPAAIGAARHGGTTLLIEYQHELGGIGTLGLIGNYCAGYLGGFTAEHDLLVGKMLGGNYGIAKAETWRLMARSAGAEIWIGAAGCGALVEGKQVKGLVVATPQGRGVVLARTVIDSTGNSDIAVAAGAQYTFIGAQSPALQGTGLGPRTLGIYYQNNDWTFVDESDLLDSWRALVLSRSIFQRSYDQSPMIQSRERRRIVGDAIILPTDLALGRTYNDTVSIARGTFDTHGFTLAPYLFLTKAGAGGGDIPLRCLLPRGIEGILVTGLGISADRDALPALRMQGDVQNQGYAAGTAAAMARDGLVRQIDIKALQRQMVKMGIAPERVLSDVDSGPISDDELAEAVRSAGSGRWVKSRDQFEAFQALKLAILFAAPKQSTPLLQKAYAQTADEKEKQNFALLLGMLGDATGVETLVTMVRQSEWDTGWNFRGMDQMGPSLSRVDNYIVALGNTRDPRALAPILEKVNRLDSGAAFSHCHAVAMALETLADPAASGPLATLLRKDGIGGHAITSIEEAKKKEGNVRSAALREIVLARALFRCGDADSLGAKTLQRYTEDLHGIYAQHARAVLKESPRRRL